MKSTRTKAGVQLRPADRISGLTDLLLCILYAAAERFESLRPKEKAI